MNTSELEVQAAKVWTMRGMARGRGIDLSDIHLVDHYEEAVLLAGRLGSPIPFAAADANYPIERLGVNGESEIDGVPRALIDSLLG